MFLITVVMRLAWILTLGLFFFFPVGTLLFVFTDLFFPKSDKSYRTLVTIELFANSGLQLIEQQKNFSGSRGRQRQK